VLFSPAPKERLEDFFDRERELDSFRRFLKSDSPLCLILGLRRSGKSSLLKVGLRESGLPSVVLDLRVLEEKVRPTYADLLDLLSGELSRLAAARSGFARPLLELLRAVEGVEVEGLRIRFKWAGRRAVKLVDVLESLERASEGRGVVSVVAFDEAQELAAVAGVRFDSVLAYAYDNFKHLKIVLTGSKVGLLYRFLRLDDPSAPLFGRAAWRIELSYFTGEQSIEFLRRGFEELSLEAREEELTEAAAALGGGPGWLSYYGFLRAQGAGHREALVEAREKGVQLLLGELENFLRLRPTARDRYAAILAAVALGARRWSEVKRGAEVRLGERIPPKNFTELLKRLLEAGLLVKRGEEYELPDPLLKEAALRLR